MPHLFESSAQSVITVKHLELNYRRAPLPVEGPKKKMTQMQQKLTNMDDEL